MMEHPYKSLPESAFWKAVSAAGPFHLLDIYSPKIGIACSDRISTAGSCFAQHIGRHLRESGFLYTDYEPAPDLLPGEERKRFGFEMFSARYGNIYTARQLLQLLQRSLGRFVPIEDHWEQNGRYFDPFRPGIEPEGFASLAELRVIRDSHFSAVRRLFTETDVFIFTFGLTEAWVSAEDGAVYPVCPGTRVGEFDQARHRFVNFSYPDVLSDMEVFISITRELNPRLKFLFTVSPVPLVATASGKHVLPATTYSKSVLRAVAGYLAESDTAVEYFPSYELISSPLMRGMFYEPDMRNVAIAGVDYVMRHFFEKHPAPTRAETPPVQDKTKSPDELICEELLLEQEAF